MSNHLTVTLPTPSTPPEGPAETQQTERPQWLPGKFKSAEELANAYKELESKLGSTKPAASDPKPSADQSPTPTTPTPIPNSIDTSKYEKEFTEKGALSEESYKELSAKGLSKEVIDQHIAFRQQAAAKQIEETLAPVGGRENYEKMVDWAAKNLSGEDIAAYNEAVQSKNPAIVKATLAGLHARYQLATGVEPSLVSGSASAHAGVVPFRDAGEMVAAMNDPRYSTSPAYRDDVMARIGASKF